jgi:hypothetical protein
MTTPTDDPSAEETAKWLLAFAVGGGGADETVEALRPWAEALARDGLDVEIEWLDALAHRRFTGSSEDPPFCAFVTIHADPAWAPTERGSPTEAPPSIFRLSAQPVFDRIECEPGEPTPGLKKTTLWRARADLTESGWHARYAGHAELVPRAHASAWRYCQNVIESAPAETTYHAVSELWWPTEADLLERFYASEEARALVAEDTQAFIDIPSAVQTVTRHQRLTRVG